MSVHLGRSIKIHLYWAMKNCGGDPNVLQQMALNIPNHYKVNVIAHYCTDSKLLVQGDCHASSPCHMTAYIPGTVYQMPYQIPQMHQQVNGVCNSTRTKI